VLQAPGVLQDDNLNLVSVGSPLLALALNDTIWFQGPDGTVGMLERESPQVITAVQWSKSGKYLAVGGKEEVQIWSQSSGNSVSFRNHSGYVTAIDWKDDNEFVAASQGEMHRYDLSSSQPLKASYDCGSEPSFPCNGIPSILLQELLAMTYACAIQGKMAGSKNLSASYTMMALSLSSFAYSKQMFSPPEEPMESRYGTFDRVS
jgi:WD40 repeat protein